MRVRPSVLHKCIKGLRIEENRTSLLSLYKYNEMKCSSEGAWLRKIFKDKPLFWKKSLKSTHTGRQHIHIMTEKLADLQTDL